MTILNLYLSTSIYDTTWFGDVRRELFLKESLNDSEPEEFSLEMNMYDWIHMCQQWVNTLKILN